MDQPRFRIAEAARMAGVSASTLRLWEAQGLVEPDRTRSGQRLYTREQIEQLKTVAWLRREKGLNPAAIADHRRRRTVAAGPRAAKAAAGAPADMPVGLKTRRLRQAAGKTLENVARETGIPVSVLSTFERTSTGLSFTSLHGLARALGTTVGALSGQEEHGERESLVRAGRWATWPPTSPGVTVQTLARGKTRMECHRFVLAPGASSEGTYQHDGEEFIHVLAGRLEIVLDGDKFFVLGAGDSFYFESRRPHAWRSVFEGETVLIWINTPPTF